MPEGDVLGAGAGAWVPSDGDAVGLAGPGASVFTAGAALGVSTLAEGVAELATGIVAEILGAGAGGGAG